MIQLDNLPLPSVAQAQLNTWQSQIDNIPDYADRVDEGKRKFKQRNKPGNRTFDQVKQVLTQMCSGARRCGYCEDSAADEVEHIQPKDLYPERVFVWENYLYVCGTCNSPKNNKYAVFAYSTGVLTQVTRKRQDPITAPEPGDPVLINPRLEDPFEFIELDLLNTFNFLPLLSLNERDLQRAKYTIEILQLNRDYLVEARTEAFDNYKARLREYVAMKQSRSSQTKLDNRIAALKRMQHPTVWREMKRYYQILKLEELELKSEELKELFSELQELFEAAPEALTW